MRRRLVLSTGRLNTGSWPPKMSVHQEDKEDSIYRLEQNFRLAIQVWARQHALREEGCLTVHTNAGRVRV